MGSGDGIEFKYTKGAETVVVTAHVDSSATELVTLLRRFMLAVGYTTETVDRVLNEDE
jgi:hypothetical protein